MYGENIRPFQRADLHARQARRRPTASRPDPAPDPFGLKYSANRAETDEIIMIVRRREDPVGRAQIEGLMAPASSPQCAALPVGRAGRIGGRPGPVKGEPVLAPFEGIADDVVNTVGIWLLLSNRVHPVSRFPRAPIPGILFPYGIFAEFGLFGVGGRIWEIFPPV